MVDSLKPGDVVKTAGGIQGRVIWRDDKNLKLEIAHGVQVDVEASKIEAKLEAHELAEPTECARCGAELNSGDQYCGACGQRVVSTTAPHPSYTDQKHKF